MVEGLSNDFCVNDFVSEGDSVEEVKILTEQLIQIMKRGRFTLCK